MTFPDQFYTKLLKEYDHDSLSYDGINGKRLANRLATLSAIGLTEDHGSRRMGYSKEERNAKECVKIWMKEAGLTVFEDGAGNVFGRVAGKSEKKGTILVGSHVDSVPNGGHFDGPLGVLTALEVVEAWNEVGYNPEKSYEVVIFSDEEGSRFKSGLTGSTAMVGDAERDKLVNLHDVFDDPFSSVIENDGLSVEGYFSSKRDLRHVEAFLEVHIEQGKRLEKENRPVGVVTGIAGPCWQQVTFTGKAGHAGNTPMNDRQDALVAASDFVRQIYPLPATVNETSVATVGQLHVKPNGINVIPGSVTLTVDIRDIYKETRDELVEKIHRLAEEVALFYDVQAEIDEKTRIPPVPIQDEMKKRIEEAILTCQIQPSFLPSGAGHDAMNLGRHIPVGMIFVRSLDGVSHHPTEWSSLNDCVYAAHVLRKTVESLMK
ncbi:Zn-dependent hydrolase [Alteribacter populi]|uniref:Zn-dependent hydrolase n=1 Tax=Alteribacter populi TaxID=2011011 RepID=UPI000BBADD05|nr:Zn-dependent hydrolase [Alteribacter populi]